jgi:hypothetical protein
MLSIGFCFSQLCCSELNFNFILDVFFFPFGGWEQNILCIQQSYQIKISRNPREHVLEVFPKRFWRKYFVPASVGEAIFPNA